MKNILLLDTSIGSLNQGDEIINLSIKENWPELFNNNYVMRMATHTPMYTPLQVLLYNKKLSVFKNADYKFLCGTNALYTNMLRPLPTWNINVLNYGLASNTICLGVGIGVNSKKTNLYTKYLYKKVLNHDYVHSVRDAKTESFLKELGFKAKNTGCPTLWGLTPKHCKTIPKNKGERVVFTLTYYEQDIENDKKMIEILKKNYKELYFWPQCIKDIEYLTKICNTNNIRIISPNVSGFTEILEREGTDYVGNRLHGGIYAMQRKCRSVIISIDYRAKEMSDSYSINCIERDKIEKLDSIIKDKWKTEITGLDFDEIKKWKNQFIKRQDEI